MKRSIRITILGGSLFLLGGTITVCTEGQPDKEKLEQEKKEPEKKEIDMAEIFGDPDLLESGQSIRSISKPMPAWKIYWMSWGAWVAVRCETVLEYIKRTSVAFKKRIIALMGLAYAEKKRKEQEEYRQA